MSDLIARLEAASHKICRDGALGMESVALLLHEAAKELSALRDQQPVAWRIDWEKPFTPSFYASLQHAEDILDGAAAAGKITPLYAHPSCVSPDKPQRPADSNESADHPVE